MEHASIAFILLPLTIVSIAPVLAHKMQHEADAKLDEIITNSEYNGNIRPYGEDGDPTVVKINMMIQSIDHIDDSDMQFSVQLLLRQQWTDHRLAYNHTPSVTRSSGTEGFAKVWSPDVVFLNEIASSLHSVVKPNSFVRVSPSGNVLHSTRLSATLSCPMNLESFPFDSQSCSITIGTFGWTTADLVLQWSDDNPVQLTSKYEAQLTRFKFKGYEVTTCDDDQKTTIVGNFSCLEVTFKFNRLFTYYLLNIYLPSFAITNLAGLIFWLPPDALDGRLTLGITTLLTLATQAYGINQNVPNVPYPKALDMWSGLCLMMISGAIVDAVIGSQLLRRRSVVCPHQVISLKKDGQGQVKGEQPQPETPMIDKVSRIMFPLVFYSLVGWYYYQYGVRQ